MGVIMGETSEIKEEILISVIHPNQVGAGRAPRVGNFVNFEITVTNNTPDSHSDAYIYFNPVSPPTEMWYVEYWEPYVGVHDLNQPTRDNPTPEGGILFYIGYLATRQTFTIKVKTYPPNIPATKTYPVEVGFQSNEKPREVLNRSEITVTGYVRSTRA
ncbi:MAG: hypothetical protein ACE5Z5_09280 [Candidatus Bathyarchaeia archaeon]